MKDKGWRMKDEGWRGKDKVSRMKDEGRKKFFYLFYKLHTVLQISNFSLVPQHGMGIT